MIKKAHFTKDIFGDMICSKEREINKLGRCQYGSLGNGSNNYGYGILQRTSSLIRLN